MTMPKGSGGVRCLDCGATASADGKGSPIVLRHAANCPESQRRADANARLLAMQSRTFKAGE